MSSGPVASQPVVDIRIQAEAFDSSQALSGCSQGADTGAIASFIGQVRQTEPSQAGEKQLLAMEVEHYPGMTESGIQAICAAANRRWPFQHCIVRHRVGRLVIGEPIVLVMIAAMHRANAFSACEYIMDRLKTEAPFWKKAIFVDGEEWVATKSSDDDRAARWQQDAT